MSRVAALAVLFMAAAAPVSGQGVDGYASVMVDAVPNEHATELRTRVFMERRVEVGSRLRLVGSGFVEGLIAERDLSKTITTAIIRPQELHAEFVWAQVDVRVGWSRVVWGRLDEFQPTDVVNPLDLTRFFLEGRVEGRMPVGMIRARWLPSDRFTVEGIYVPLFRRARYDQLDEETSPFNVVPPLPVNSDKPARTFGNAQGGIRASVTTGRVDWSVTAYRGFTSLPVYEVEGFTLREHFPRFTMIGGDFETVRGEWGLRGEVAVREDAFEGGVGVDRRAGAYRVSGNLLVSDTGAAEANTGTAHATNVSLVAALDRSFARESRHLRTFAVYNPRDDSAFARAILALNLKDDVTFELSGGVFAGTGRSRLGRFASRDFVYARVKLFF
jgi:hypothetical protein